MFLTPWAFELAAFLLGLLFGSFLNVCISRLPLHKSISKPRSHCPRCLATIRWYDNIPLLSFILLRARCRNCKARISWRYPLVELAIGLWFLTVVAQFRMNDNKFHHWGQPFGLMDLSLGSFSFALAILGFLLIGLAVMDWQTHTLPDAFTLTGTLLGFLLCCVQAAFLPTGEGDIKLQHALRMSSPGSFAAKGNVFLTGAEHMVLGRLLAIVAAAGLILAIRSTYKVIRGHNALGLGDVKLMAMLAAFLGFWPAMLALFVGIITCAIYAVTLLARRRATRTSQLPLGTFLSLGGLISAFFGQQLIDGYLALLR